MPVTLTSPTEILKADAVSDLMRCSRIATLDAFTPTCAPSGVFQDYSDISSLNYQISGNQRTKAAPYSLVQLHGLIQAATCPRVTIPTISDMLGTWYIRVVLERDTLCAISSRDVPLR